MRVTIAGGVLVAGVCLGAALRAPSEEPREKVRGATGIERREPWTTSKVRGSPDPPHPYRMENAFPKLTFDEPLELAAVPGRASGPGRLAVAQRRGKLFTFV